MLAKIMRLFIFFLFISEYTLFSCSLFADDHDSERGFQNDSLAIARTINALKIFRQFPNLAGYRNTSVQKAPAPILAKISEDSFGRAKITRCWLNLDEVWNYRTRQFDFDFQIGVDKYKDVEEKFRETWNGEIQVDFTLYDYLQAFSQHSDEIMLTIRRYERDILDGKLPIGMDDWEMVFKTALKNYKEHFPKIRYVEVGNEYALSGFVGATHEEYYQFYKAGYRAVNAVNEELGLTGENKILVGGPVCTGNVLDKIDYFLEFFFIDTNMNKTLDFVSWHDYHKTVSETSTRQGKVAELLKKYKMPETLPMFITEHDPFHFNVDGLEYHYMNTAYLPKTLYFASLYSPNVKIFPWVQYHDRTKQTKFMWFDGPNNLNTKEDELKMLPLGCSVQFLCMLKGKEIEIDNSIEGNDLVLAAFNENKLVVEAINYDTTRNVVLTIKNLREIFPNAENEKIRVKKYLIERNFSNCLTDKSYPGGIEKIADFDLSAVKNQIELNHILLKTNGLVLWEIMEK